jgi:putative PEP-CTERM system TPR-repeat lipoprotein
VDEILNRAPGQPAALFLRAQILEHDGKYSDALAVLVPAAHALEDFFPAQILLGELNLRIGHSDLAEAYAQHAVALAPNEISAKILLALIYTRDNQPLKVVEVLRPVVAGAPDNPQAEMILGDAYGRLGRFNEAEKALEIASHQNPTDADLRTRLDASRLNSDSRDAGMKDLAALVKADPQAWQASLLLVSATINLGHPSEAARLALDLRQTQPNNPLIDNQLGRIDEMMGDWGKAEIDFQSALNKQPAFFDAARNLVLIRQVRSEPDEAPAIYAAILKADPANLDAMMAIAGSAQAKGNPDEAMRWVEKAAAAAPDSIEIRVRLVELLIMQKKTQEALAAAQSLDQSKHDVPAVVTVLARAQLAAGQQDSAILSLRHLAELDPDAALGQFRLGEALISLGRPEDAVAVFQSAVAAQPAYLPAWQALVATEARTAGVAQSLDIIKQATTLEAVAPYGDALTGEAYLAVKRYAEAEGEFRAALTRTPDVRWMLRLAQTQEQAGDQTGMIATLSDWLKSHPNDPAVRGVYADALLANKSDMAAEREYKALLAIDPVNVSVLNNLAWLNREADPKKASEYADLAFGLAPQSAQVRDTLAWISLRKGDVATATALAQMAHAQMPEDPEISYHLATTLARAGDTRGARALVAPLVQSKVAFSNQDDAVKLLNTLGTAE